MMMQLLGFMAPWQGSSSHDSGQQATSTTSIISSTTSIVAAASTHRDVLQQLLHHSRNHAVQRHAQLCGQRLQGLAALEEEGQGAGALQAPDLQARGVSMSDSELSGVHQAASLVAMC
jgi:hypothetical protein